MIAVCSNAVDHLIGTYVTSPSSAASLRIALIRLIMACLSGVNNSPWIPIKELPEEDEVISEAKTFTCVPLIVFVEYSLSFAKT